MANTSFGLLSFKNQNVKCIPNERKRRIKPDKSQIPPPHGSPSMPLVALVTGASRGLGLSIAKELLLQNYTVYLLSRPSPSLNSALKSLLLLSPNCQKVECDLLDVEACVRAVRAVGRVDVLVNNGLYQGPESTVESTNEGEIRKALVGNVLAQVEIAKECMKGMKARNRGWVFQLVSSSSRARPIKSVEFGGFQSFAYTASKAAIAKLVPLLAVENSENNIRFFNVDPGLVITDKMRDEGTVAKFEKWGAVPPEWTAKVVAQLSMRDCNDPLVVKYNGEDFVQVTKLYKEIAENKANL